MLTLPGATSDAAGPVLQPVAAVQHLQLPQVSAQARSMLLHSSPRWHASCHDIILRLGVASHSTVLQQCGSFDVVMVAGMSTSPYWTWRCCCRHRVPASTFCAPPGALMQYESCQGARLPRHACHGLCHLRLFQPLLIPVGTCAVSSMSLTTSQPLPKSQSNSCSIRRSVAQGCGGRAPGAVRPSRCAGERDGLLLLRQPGYINVSNLNSFKIKCICNSAELR